MSHWRGRGTHSTALCKSRADTTTPVWVNGAAAIASRFSGHRSFTLARPFAAEPSVGGSAARIITGRTSLRSGIRRGVPGQSAKVGARVTPATGSNTAGTIPRLSSVIASDKRLVIGNGDSAILQTTPQLRRKSGSLTHFSREPCCRRDLANNILLAGHLICRINEDVPC